MKKKKKQKAKAEVNFKLFDQSTTSLIKKKGNAPVEILSTVYFNERTTKKLSKRENQQA